MANGGGKSSSSLDVTDFSVGPPVEGWEFVLLVLYVHSIYLMTFLGVPLLAYLTLVKTSGWVWVMCAFIWGSYLFVTYDGSEKRSGRRWADFSTNSWGNKTMRRYFNLKFHIPRDLSTNPVASPVVLSMHPHGVVSDWRMLVDGVIPEAIPVSHKGYRTLAASSLFYLPGLRELALWTGCIDASRDVATGCLQDGYSCIVVPGGQKEMGVTEYQKEKVVLSDRDGFLKLSMREQLPVIPAYVFGCNDAYYTSTAGQGIREMIRKTTGVSLPIFWGKYGFMPLPTKLDIVFGHPITPPPLRRSSTSAASTTAGVDGSDADNEQSTPPTTTTGPTIDVNDLKQFHKQYCEALLQIYEDNKANFANTKGRKLQVL